LRPAWAEYNDEIAVTLWGLVELAGLADLVLCFVPIPIFGWIQWRRRSRIERGVRANCVFRLTGIASGVCPKCGGAAAIFSLQ